MIIGFLPAGCVSKPSGIEVVGNFNVDRYLGLWYEIARLDHSFERGLDNVTAQYSKRPGNGIDVLNRGYDAKERQWREARGVAYFRQREDMGSLKVTFFPPFYGTYDIIALDHENYEYSMVAGPGRRYLWLLSRTPTLHEDRLNALLELARRHGFNTDALIFVKHDKAHVK